MCLAHNQLRPIEGNLLMIHGTFASFPRALLIREMSLSYLHFNIILCSLKKLHKVQLLVDASCNVFYQANLERQSRQDNVIGTRNFAANQCDLNFSWAQMEAYAQPPSHATPDAPTDEADMAATVTELGKQGRQSGNSNSNSNMTDTTWRNYSHFVQVSGIDFRSSMQLVFDVLQQMIEVSLLATATT